MNTRKILGACLATASVVGMCLPALAIKSVPATGKARVASRMKCAKVNNKISAKDKTTPVVSLKKNK